MIGPRDEETIVLIILFTIVLIIGVIGNSLIIYIAGIRSNKQHRSAFNEMIHYLAVVDLVSSLVIPTMVIYRTVTKNRTWHFGSFGCHFLTGFVPLSMMISIGMILLITVDRCRIICSPYKREITQREVRVSIVMVFVFSLIFAIPRMVFTPRMATRIEVTFIFAGNFSDQNFPYHSVGSSFPENGLYQRQHGNKSVKIYTGYDTCKGETVHREFKKMKHLMEKGNRPGHKYSCREVSSSDCLITKTTWYLYYDVALKLTRDILFVLVFCLSNAFIYRKLYDKEIKKMLGDQKSTRVRQKSFRMLIAMAIVFMLLVLPKDIYDLVFDISWLHPPGLDMVSSHLLVMLNKLLLLLQTCNCICNVFIYARMDLNFRKILNHLSLKRKRAYTFSLTTVTHGELDEEEFNRLQETVL